MAEDIYTIYTHCGTSHRFCSLFNSLLWFSSLCWFKQQRSVLRQPHSLVHRQAVQCGGSGGQRLAEWAGAGHAGEVPVGAGQVEGVLQKALDWSVKTQEAGGRRGVRGWGWRRRSWVMLESGRRAAHQRVQGLGQRMQREVGCGGCSGDSGVSNRVSGRVGSGAALHGCTAPVNIPH